MTTGIHTIFDEDRVFHPLDPSKLLQYLQAIHHIFVNVSTSRN